MADEKKTVRETKEGTKTNKFIAFFKNLPQNIATPFKNMWHELKKVTWPTKQDLIKYTGIVLLFMVFMGVVIGLLDMGSTALVSAISSVNNTDSGEEIIVQPAEDADDAGAVPQEEAEGAEQAGQEAAQEVTEAAEQTAETAAEAGQEAAQEVAEAAEQAAEAAAETAEEAAQEAVSEAAETPAEGNN